ncbi:MULTISPECIES: SRPBCC family protein [unclassified Paenibacillus]|uniref:SRPBCC family protein n=1 Tax=unclassified Paenibacillus TaxID=185978 RepID=UPI0011A8E873|nr:SRPBCC family protein [Paenibacillus sp. Y412MC10]
MNNERSVIHETFVIERNYQAAPAKVFSAWSDPELKSAWFPKADSFEFKVGGREVNAGGPPDGPVFTFDAVYQEIAENERIVYTYTLDQGDSRMSISVVSVQFQASGQGTRLIYTEHGAFLDGLDTASMREHGTKIMLDKLGEVVAE